MASELRIGLIGIGKLGSALLAGLESRAAAQGLRVKGYRRGDSLANVGTDHDVLVVCVKPAQTLELLRQIAPQLGAQHAILSVAAGVKVADLETASGGRAGVVRVVVNTPAAVGHGVSALIAGRAATSETLRRAHAVFSAVGTTCEIPESQADAVTSLTACGPAFVFQILEAFTDAGIANGVPAAMSLDLSVQTLIGACEMARQTKRPPAELRQQVTTPGGATIEGVVALERHGLRAALIEAVTVSAEKARKLGG